MKDPIVKTFGHKMANRTITHYQTNSGKHFMVIHVAEPNGIRNTSEETIYEIKNTKPTQVRKIYLMPGSRLTASATDIIEAG